MLTKAQTLLKVSNIDYSIKFITVLIVNMINFLIDKSIQFGDRIFQQTVSIPMGTNCAPLLADLFLHSYEVELFVQELLRKGEKKLAQSFNYTFRCIHVDDVLSLNTKNSGTFYT